MVHAGTQVFNNFPDFIFVDLKYKWLVLVDQYQISHLFAEKECHSVINRCQLKIYEIKQRQKRLELKGLLRKETASKFRRNSKFETCKTQNRGLAKLDTIIYWHKCELIIIIIMGLVSARRFI